MSTADLETGTLNTSWLPEITHPSFPPEMRGPALSKAAISGILVGALKGAWEVTDEWNTLLPHFKFTKLDHFLREIWEGKP